MAWNVLEGDCIEVMQTFPAGCIDAIVTDPPYGLGFMGKKWDALPPGDEWAAKCFRVCKPGAHVVAFGGTRTIHRLAAAIENAGFEIRDQIAWAYWNGFPKSMDPAVDGFEGYGTALKPAYEPAILARKPLEGTVAENVRKHGTGAINVDACRYRLGDPAWPGPQDSLTSNHSDTGAHVSTSYRKRNCETHTTKGQMIGRFPANLYACAKPTRKERDRGCYHLQGMTGGQATERKEGSAGINNPRAGAGRTAAEVKNYHPTVKPIGLMAWLCRLVGGQKGSLILDPFAGSGTTGIGAIAGGFRFIGVERDPGYAAIARARILGANPLFNSHDETLGRF